MQVTLMEFLQGYIYIYIYMLGWLVVKCPVVRAMNPYGHGDISNSLKDRY